MGSRIVQTYKIQNSREIKKLRLLMEKQYGFFHSGDYAFLLSEKGRLFLVNKSISKVNLEHLKIDRMGLYFGELKENHFRLSKEGAQFIVKLGGKQVKPIIDFTSDEVKAYFQGEDLPQDLGESSKAIILRYKNEILGCAQYKEGKILNFLPKTYRGTVIV